MTSTSYIQSENHQRLMTMSYEEKRAAANVWKNDKSAPYLHRVYTYEDRGFPAVHCYLPLRFSKKVTNPEEQYRIQSLVCDAYMKRPAFRKYIDDNCDFVADPTAHIWVSMGFHESVIDNKAVVHFTIRLQRDVETEMKPTSVPVSPAIHLILERHSIEIYKITMMVEM